VVISSSPLCIFPYNLTQDIFIQSKVIDIFPKFEMAAAAILDFQFMWIWTFRRVDSAVFVFCTKFGSNMCYSHWDRHTYASDLHLITSRELTSGFDFWLRGHLRFDVVHLPIQCDARYFYPVQSYWHFSEIQDGGRRHLGFSVYVNFRRVDSVVFVFRTKFGSNSLFFMCGLHSVMP